MWLRLMSYLFSSTADVLSCIESPSLSCTTRDSHSLCMANKKIFIGAHLQSNEVKVTLQYSSNLALFFGDDIGLSVNSVMVLWDMRPSYKI